MGDELAKQFRANGYQNLIIGLIGNAEDEEMNAFFDCGADIIVPGQLRAAQMDTLLNFTRSNGVQSTGKNKRILDKRFKNEYVIRRVVR
jgi:hypothetical protein